MIESGHGEYGGWEQRLSRIAEAVEIWRKRTTEDPISAEQGSDLDADDHELSGFKVSTLAAYSITVATEHLDFSLDVMRATRTLYPTSYLTVLRTALLTASHAVWVLEPNDRASRRKRALRVAADDVRSQMTMVLGSSAYTPKMVVAKLSAIDSLAKRQSGLQETANQLGLDEKVQKVRLDNTSIINLAARHCHVERDVKEGVDLVWRTASAAAHGQRSFAVQRAARDAPTQGPRIAQLRGDLVNDVGPAAAAAAMTLDGAFRLFDRRGTVP